MSQPSPVRQVRLGADLDAFFDRALVARGVAASELLRSAVARELAVDSDGNRMPPADPVLTPDPAPSLVRLTLRLPRAVVSAARHHASSKGMAVSRWIAALTQAKVATRPVLTQIELASLNRCTRSVDAIGRNINQIAHALNESRLQDSTRVDKTTALLPRISAELEVLYSKIEDTQIQITALTEASRGTWEPH